MNKEARDAEFRNVVLPLIKWMAENCHPHTIVVVDSMSAELLEGQFMFRTHEAYTKEGNPHD